jgi:hypothetical protein
MYEHTHPFRLVKLTMAFTECLKAARITALSFSFFFLFIFGHRLNVKKTSERKKIRDREEKSSKQGGDSDEEGNLRLIRVASEEKREVISHPLGLVSGKTHFFKTPVSQL